MSIKSVFWNRPIEPQLMSFEIQLLEHFCHPRKKLPTWQPSYMHFLPQPCETTLMFLPIHLPFLGISKEWTLTISDLASVKVPSCRSSVQGLALLTVADYQVWRPAMNCTYSMQQSACQGAHLSFLLDEYLWVNLLSHMVPCFDFGVADHCCFPYCLHQQDRRAVISFHPRQHLFSVSLYRLETLPLQ